MLNDLFCILYTYRIVDILFANGPSTDHGKSRLHKEDESASQYEQPIRHLGDRDILLVYGAAFACGVPSHLDPFGNALHDLQYIVAMRVGTRVVDRHGGGVGVELLRLELASWPARWTSTSDQRAIIERQIVLSYR
jgi:hypothetical protein